MRKLSVFLAASIAFASCIKQYEPEPYTDPCTTGTIQFVNNSENPYDVYVDGSKVKQQSGGTSFKHTVTKGSHTVKVQQVSGYLFEPTVKNYDGSVDGCENIVISYP